MFSLVFPHVDQVGRFGDGWNAASTTAAGVPTRVITVRLVAWPGSTSNKRVPSTEPKAAEILSMIGCLRPSEKLGTHSINGVAMVKFYAKVKGMFGFGPNFRG